MDENKVGLFMSVHADKFKPEQMPLVKKKLQELSEEKYAVVQSLPYKNPKIMLVLSFFLGHWGIDRFMLEDMPMGIVKLLTCGGSGILTVIDWVLIMDKTRDYNYQKFLNATMSLYGSC